MKATPFGGLYVFTEFLHQIGFHKRFTTCFKRLRKVRQYAQSPMELSQIKQVILKITLNHGKMPKIFTLMSLTQNAGYIC
jgi:hypothetical protein